MRLFVALDPGPLVREEIARALEDVRPKAPGAKWVAPESVHVTLAFLGWVDDARAGAIDAAVAEVARRHAPATLAVRGSGTFGAPRRPRVLWLGLSGDLAAVGALQEDVEAALAPHGHAPDERPFSAHLTLARAREAGGDPALVACAAALSRADLGVMRVDEVVLYRSDAGQAGPIYTAVGRHPLGAA